MSDRKDVLRQALAAIETLEAKLAAARTNSANEPIAIVGIACRLPGGINSPDDYWHLLSNGVDAVREIPADRWDVAAYYDPDPSVPGKMCTRRGGFLDRVDEFDPAFFNISPREAASLDPQQRLLLELSWEALERAGVSPDTLEGSRTGVFVGITTTDYAKRIDVMDPERSDVYVATGNALNAAAGRLSFTLGLQGPCVAMDTACSSSLTAVHAACQSLRTRESALAFAGGVNVMLSADAFILFSKWGMLAPDGRVKAFDARADGFVRGEGCGMLLLERLSDARANGHRVLAVIRGSAVNQDGRSSGLTVPNGLAQQAVIRQALDLAQLQPTDVQYVEAHGTGTSLGDPIEVEALAAVYGTGRSPSRPLEIGSVKSNLGHLESASGVTGLIKLVLSLQHRAIPASLHFEHPSPAIAWDRMPVRVSTRLHAWEADSGTRIGAVSSFGFSGTNAHVVVAEAPEEAQAPAVARSAEIVPLSAKSEAALAVLLARATEHLNAHPELSLADLAHTARVGRGHFAYRAAVIAKDRPELLVNLGRAAHGQAGRVRVAFLFTGQGAQYAGMGQALYVSEPVFRDVVDRCAKALMDVLDRDLRTVMFDDGPNLLDQTRYAQPALYALEVGLARLWQSWGIEPALVLGHSVGEYAAACIAGVYDVETGARLIAERGLRMQELPGSGAMLALQGERESVDRAVAALLDREREVSLAARNAPGSVVLSGPQGVLERSIEPLTREGLTTHRLAVSHAFHSNQMEPMLARFEAFAMSVPHRAPRIMWVSNLTGEVLNTTEWSGRMGEYWRRHVREPVQFERGLTTAAAQGIDVFVEVGPHPVLCGLGRTTLSAQPQTLWVESLRRGVAAEETLLPSLGRLYVRGAKIDWRAFGRERGGRIVDLPTYPFQRQRHWLDETPRTARRPASAGVHPLLGERLDRAGVTACFERSVTRNDPGFLVDHRIGGQIVMPMTGYLEMALAAARIALEGERVAIEDLTLEAPLVFHDDSTRTLQVVVDEADEHGIPRVRVFSKTGARTGWTLHARAQIVAAEPRDLAVKSAATAVEHRGESLDCASLYAKLRDIGVEFGPAFLGLQTAARTGERATVGRVVAPPSVQPQAKHYLCHPAMLDACLHVAAFALASDTPENEHIYLPVGVDRFVLFRPLPDVVSSAVHLREGVIGEATASLDLHVYAESGEPVAVLEGVRCRRMSRDFFTGSVTKDIDTLTYRVAWRPFDVPMTIPAIARGAWVVLEDADGAGAAVAEELSARGAYVVRVTPGVAFRALSKDRIEIDPLCAEDYSRLLANAATRAPLKGIVDLWALRVPELTSTGQPSDLQTFGASAALLLAQAVTARADAADLGLWFVTRGAQATSEHERVRCEQAPVWGLGKVVGLEHPEMRTTLIDLDGAAPPADAVTSLMALLLGATDEPQIALRGAHCLRARLAPLPIPRQSAAQSLPVVKSDATYLVTGGLGGLGLLGAEWLTEQGARHLVLAGRRAPDEVARGTIDRLRLRGATITVVQSDVSTGAGVEQLLAASGRSLKGILHCAGVLADGVLAQQSRASLATVLKPKADGAWRLHTRLRELAMSLDFFVSFSSLSAVMGAAAQANYVAANSFLDALASDRRAQGLTALSVGWGSWADAGMAARADVVDRFAAQGIRPLHASEAFATLTTLLRGSVSHVAVAPIDWKTLSQQLRGVRAARLLEELFERAPSGGRAPNEASALVTAAALTQLDRGARLQALRELVRSSLSGVLRLRRADGELADEQPFAALGLDSLTAIELRNALHAQLGVRLAPTVGFDHPTLGALASHLNQLLEATVANEPVETSAATGEREEVML